MVAVDIRRQTVDSAGRKGARPDVVGRRTAAALALVAVVSAPATALETDQHYAWGVPLADSTAAVNARFNLELERAITGFPEHRPPETCRQIAAAYRSRLRFLLLHDIQMWAWNSQLVARIPDGGAAWREYNRTHLYSRNPRYDPAT